MAWNFVRVPIVYTCLCFETMFWSQGAESTERMSTQVIGEMQHFLHDRSKIMIDYYDLHFGKKIGEGATAEVYVVSLNRITRKHTFKHTFKQIPRPIQRS